MCTCLMSCKLLSAREHRHQCQVLLEKMHLEVEATVLTGKGMVWATRLRHPCMQGPWQVVRATVL